MKLKEWVEKAKKQVDGLDAELLAMAALGFDDRVDIILYSEDEFDFTEADKMLGKRVLGVPLAYITGKKEFYGRDFEVNPSVLIPRPETEQMIISAMGIIDVEKLENVLILDVGTGSGCIPITLKLELDKEKKTAKVFGADVSVPALEVAEENAEKLGAEVKFFRSDLLTEIDELPDIMTANLPYVDFKWDWISDNLKFEPALALYADDGGLKIIKRLIDEIVEMKKRKKIMVGEGIVKPQKRFLLLEADESQHGAIEKYAKDRGFEKVSKDGLILGFSYE